MTMHPPVNAEPPWNPPPEPWHAEVDGFPDSPESPDLGPQITGTIPTELLSGEGYGAFQVNGSGFIDGSSIELDGTGITTAFDSAEMVFIPDYVAPDAPGTITVTVRNPDSSESNDWPVTIT